MDTTRISIGERVKKSFQNPYGWENVDSIPFNEVCILVLGGNGTNSDEKANGYTKSIENLLEERSLRKGVGIYAIVYHVKPIAEEPLGAYLIHKRNREALFEKHNRKIKKEAGSQERALAEKFKNRFGDHVLDSDYREIENPAYIQDLFDKVLLKRISDNGKKRSVAEACSLVRKLNIVTHCHGAYVFLKLEELMQKTMKELKYTDEEMSQIQKQLLCVSHGPYAPLGVSKSTMISFGSALDNQVFHQNNFHLQIQKMADEGKLKFSYFSKEKGELFLAPSITPDKDKAIEHVFFDYIYPRYDLTKDGYHILEFSSNAIIGGVKSALAEEPLPNVKTLVCGGKAENESLFDEAEKNGREVYQSMVSDLRFKAFQKQQNFR